MDPVRHECSAKVEAKLRCLVLETELLLMQNAVNLRAREAITSDGLQRLCTKEDI